MKRGSTCSNKCIGSDQQKTLIEDARAKPGTMQLTCNPHDQRSWRHLNARLSKGLSQSESQYLEEKLWKGAPCEELCLWDEQVMEIIMALRWVPSPKAMR